MQHADLPKLLSILIAAYIGVILYFVVRGARRTKSMTDYAVGNMAFSPWFVGLSLAAASTSAATFIINPGFIALYGWSAVLAFAVFLPLGKYISLILMTKRFRKQGMDVKAISMAQWIGKRYASKSFALFFAVLSLLLVTFMVLICVGMTKVLAQGLGVGEMSALAAIVVFVFGYMMFGGANSMVYTNTIQAFFKLVVALLLLGSGYKYLSAGIDDFWRQLAAIEPVLTASTNPGSPLFRDFFEIAFCPFVVGIAIVCQPHIITKSLMLKEERDVNAYLTAGIAAEIIFFSVVITGLFARLTFPDLSGMKMDGIIPAYVVREFSLVAALVVAMGLLSSGLATFEGLIQSLSTTVTTDIVGVVWRDKLAGDETRQQQQLQRINKVVIAALAVLTFFLARNQLQHPKLSVGIFAQVGVYAFFSTAFVPVLFGIFFKTMPRTAAVAAAVTAVSVHFGTYFGGISPYLQGPVRNPAVAAAFAILSSLAVGLAVHYFTTPGRSAMFPRFSAGRAVVVLLVLAAMVSGIACAPKTTAVPNNSNAVKYVDLPSGIRMAYTDAGKGEQTLLFVHGLGSNLKSWQKNTPVLSAHARCITLDLPGYGQSAKGDFPFDMTFFAKTLREFVRTLGLKNVVPVGHSMGGQVVLHCLLQDSAFARKIVLLAPAGFETFSAQDKAWFSAVYTPAVVKATPPEQIRKNFELNFFRFPADAEFMVQDRLILRATPEYDAYCAMIPKCVAGMLNEPVFDRLSGIKTPALIVYGQNDLLIPNRFLHQELTTEQVAENGHKKLKNSQLNMLPGCGHFVQWDGATLVNKTILEFIR